MPTYEYKCQSCQHRFEAFQSMTDKPLAECPECRGPVKRLIGTGAGFLFRGSGFYITDYRSESYKQAAKRAAGDSSSSTSSSSGSTTSTAAAPAATAGGSGSTEKKKP